MKTLLSIGLLFTTAAAFAAYNAADTTGGAYDATVGARPGLLGSTMRDATGTAGDALRRYGYSRPGMGAAGYNPEGRPDFTTMGSAGTTDTNPVDGTMAPTTDDTGAM